MGIRSKYDQNMPETIKEMFLVLFNDDSWTWSELAKVLVERYGIVDLGELNDSIVNEMKSQGGTL